MMAQKNASGVRVRKLQLRLIVAAMSLAMPVLSWSAADRVRGHDLYLKHCSACHGVDGRSVMPNLASFNFNQGMMQPDVVLLNKLRMGTGQMPPFFGILTDKDLLDVIAYLRTTRF